ncbi:unnamed protein product [Prorocentrum cordatum]|uniref:Glutathione peroxidase n=1 Tax=Prorocentrum cordatum TaxID=2364126 RepID=A0ABN9VHG7_9DINO|nr:unnamed protein product [Polarella glacialis]|mmetsp:Transcript_92603/g.241267  ORF Transcript_92603/g.241267 Transcript_92603/m.241267 type:complete len:118 (-) Transcript_92603:149-502(-)
MKKLSDRFASGGFTVLCFPCNQFGFQEPRGAASIQKWTKKKGYITSHMRVMEKVNVSKGMTGVACPVFKFLQDTTGVRINWNFGAYFLVDRSGEVTGYKTSPGELTETIEALLEAKM